MNTKTTEPDRLLYKLRDIKYAHPWLNLIEKSHSTLVNELVFVQKQARDYGEKHINPVALEIDKKVEHSHDYFAWDLVHQAKEFRFLSYLIPKGFGGMGFGTTHFAILMEELCSFCAGVANIFGAHALGISPILMAPDIKHFEKYLRQVARSEKEGNPELFALAITEPGAGSDVEDVEHMKTAKLCTWAKRVDGGYILNGRKVFISNGSVAKYIWVSASMDKSNPEKSVVSFIVPNDTVGFSVGSIEKKLGQRACPVAELVFDDVFIPTENRVGDEGESERLIASVLGASRGPVAAIATGIARGAFQALLKYLNENKRNGHYLFEEQWVQLELVNLMAKIQIARKLYFEATLCCDLLGTPKLLAHPLVKLLGIIPQPLLCNRIGKTIFTSNFMYSNVRKYAESNVAEVDIQQIAGLSSIAKYTASDLAVEVTSRAMEIMGADGAVQEYGVEKFYRDAKLTQIYEGTNQINRVYAFKNLL